MKTARRLGAALLVTVALSACSSDSEDANSVPHYWISQQYASVPLGYVDEKDGPSEVAEEIDDHTSARDRSAAGDAVFLRYRDDIVSITPRKRRGSQIEVADYRTGYHRWNTKLPSSWPHPDSDAFRGGGPGTGK
jgi:hypothetical protein